MRTLIVTTLFDLDNGSIARYLKPFRDHISSYLQYTDFDILVLSNCIDKVKDTFHDRVSFIDYDKNFNEPVISCKRFNMHLKRLAIRLGSEKDYDIIYHHDCDFYITGWDQESYLELINRDYDIIYPNSSRPQLGALRRNYPHFQKKVEDEFGDLYYDELDQAPNASETAIIFKNNNKLKIFLDFWDKIAEKNNDFFTYHCAVYFGTAAVHSKMNITHVTEKNKFSKYARIHHNGKLLNYYGRYI